MPSIPTAISYYFSDGNVLKEVLKAWQIDIYTNSSKFPGSCPVCIYENANFNECQRRKKSYSILDDWHVSVPAQGSPGRQPPFKINDLSTEWMRGRFGGRSEQ